MTNAALQAFIAEFGARMIVIVIDNNHKIMFGVQAMGDNAIFYTDIQYKTVGDVDMFGVTRTDNTWGKAVTFTNWYVTACIQMISTTETEDIDLPDLNKYF